MGNTERMNILNTTNNGLGRPLAKFVFLGNGSQSQTQTGHGDTGRMNPSLPSPLVRKDAKVSQKEEWNVVYTIDVEVPPWAKNLTLTLTWILMYSSYKDATAGYPTNMCSFQGAPNGSFVLPNDAKQAEIMDPPNDIVVVHRPSSWLRRQSVNSEWTYYSNQDYSHKKMSCNTPWNKTRSYSVLIVGDSQPNYMCERLANYTSTSTRCVSLKGNFTNESRTELQDFSEGYSNVLSQAQEDVVIFNTQGLWETAYGRLDLFPTKLDTVLDSIPSRTKERTYFFLTTTAVHPVNYKPGIFLDERKWTMTQPRVQAINAASRERIHASPNNNKGIFVIDVEALSLLREDDPMVKGDMRHYGNRTNELLLAHVLCELDKRLLPN